MFKPVLNNGPISKPGSRLLGNNIQGGNTSSPFPTAEYTDAEIQALITSGYIPVASAADLNAVRTTYADASTREFAAGTKWATGEINTTGLSDKYVQVANIDLYDATRVGGAYYNGGLGWAAIGTQFKGIYDGGGFIVNGMYINRATDYNGLFRIVSEGGIIRNVANINIEIITSASYNGGICGAALTPASGSVINTIDGCVVSGVIASTGAAENYNSGILGSISGFTPDVLISNCVSNVSITSEGDYVGGITSRLGTPLSSIINCYSIGYISVGASKVGAIVGYVQGVDGGPVITNCYFTPETCNINYSIGIDANNEGNPTSLGTKSIAEMISGKPSLLIFTDWSTDYWWFNAAYFPVLKRFGVLPVFNNIPT